jgi:hypothetical protein
VSAGQRNGLALDRETKEKNMNIKLNALCLGGFLALTSFLAQPVKADEWNKKIEFQFSAPVQIPGKVLPAGKYVFQLLDSDSDRNIVQVFSEDAGGKDTLVATLLAIPDYMPETPDKPVVHFDERPAGTPEAIHSYYYPGENTGWEFVYPKGEASQTSASVTPAAAPVETAAAPSLAAPPEVKTEEPTQEEVTAVEHEVMEETPNATADAPVPMPSPEADTQVTAEMTMLPETAGHSGLELMAGVAMLGAGALTVLASRRTSVV